MESAWIRLAYLAGTVLFILGLKALSHPRSAPRGNLLGACGMLVAVVATLLDARIVTFGWIVAGLAAGGAVGAVLAWRVEMTSMPQMVALLNGLGGGASALVAAAEQYGYAPGVSVPVRQIVAGAASGLIGAATLAGSLVAAGKLHGALPERSIALPAHARWSLSAALACVGLAVWFVADPLSIANWILLPAACLLGVLLVLPIGGADMPVAVSLLNAYSGLAAAATGFVLGNSMLIVTGALVGASGLILTRIMCRAMNRSLRDVLFGVSSGGGTAAAGGDVYGGKVKAATAEEVAMILADARRVVIVPGYGLAVAQAQHAVRDLANLLEARRAEVLYAIHPVAGRMPGHMNVLLAEADVSYDKLKEMDEINPSFEQTDVAVVIGANDVVNPAARTDPQSPIAGMPILDVDKAKTVIVLKRSLSPGYAGIPNPLFAADNALLFFADAKKGLLDVIAALKQV